MEVIEINEDKLNASIKLNVPHQLNKFIIFHFKFYVYGLQKKALELRSIGVCKIPYGFYTFIQPHISDIFFYFKALQN